MAYHWTDHGTDVAVRFLCAECGAARNVALPTRFRLAAVPNSAAVAVVRADLMRAFGASKILHHAEALPAAAELAARAACARLGLGPELSDDAPDAGPFVVLLSETATRVTAMPDDHRAPVIVLEVHASDPHPLVAVAAALTRADLEADAPDVVARAMAWWEWRPVGCAG